MVLNILWIIEDHVCSVKLLAYSLGPVWPALCWRAEVDEHISSLFPGSKKKRSILITICLCTQCFCQSVDVEGLYCRDITTYLVLAEIQNFIIRLNISKLTLLYFYGLGALSSEFWNAYLYSIKGFTTIGFIGWEIGWRFLWQANREKYRETPSAPSGL
jgi:hypothetical protein